MPKVVVSKQECLLLTERGRFGPDIDDDIVDGTVCASDQFRLTVAGTPMHSSYGTRLRVLNEKCGRTQNADVFAEEGCIEASGEQAPGIVKRLRHENHHVGKLGALDPNGTIVA